MISYSSQEFTASPLWERGWLFVLFSLGILRGMRLIVTGDFLTGISHILLKPPGVVRNQMTAWALRFGRRREVSAKQPCMSPQQRVALLCQSAAPNAAAALWSVVCTFQTCADPEQEETISLSDAVQTATPLMSKKHKKGSGAIRNFPLWCGRTPRVDSCGDMWASGRHYCLTSCLCSCAEKEMESASPLGAQGCR